MFRTDLQFLEAMFPEGNFKDYPILIVNQTDKKRQLQSDSETIRVINTEERGLPQSRNMAIQNAIGTICLIADDDVHYVSNFREIILSAYTEHPDAEVLTFQMTDTKGVLYRDYPKVHRHTQKSIKMVNSVVITIKPEALRKKQVFYNLHFGLGTTFPTGDEYVFMKSVLKEGLKAYYRAQVILSHPSYSSGQLMEDDTVIYARAALTYKYYGFLSYLWVFKYVRFLITHNYIDFKSSIRKIRAGFAGIRHYKTLIKNELEKR